MRSNWFNMHTIVSCNAKIFQLPFICCCQFSTFHNGINSIPVFIQRRQKYHWNGLNCHSRFWDRGVIVYCEIQCDRQQTAAFLRLLMLLLLLLLSLPRPSLCVLCSMVVCFRCFVMLLPCVMLYVHTFKRALTHAYFHCLTHLRTCFLSPSLSLILILSTSVFSVISVQFHWWWWCWWQWHGEWHWNEYI